jgi:hypothetical protein
LAACGSDDEGTATTAFAGDVVTSDDGALTIAVPVGATDEAVSATLVADADVPAELDDEVFAGPVYLLGPDGSDFAEPLTLTLTQPVSEFADEGRTPLLVPVLYSPSEGFSLLEGATVEIVDGMVTISGTTTHFSYLTEVRIGQPIATLDPDPVIAEVGATFTIELVSSETGVEGVGWSATPPVTPLENRERTHDFECTEVGSASVTVEVNFDFGDPRSSVHPVADFLNELLEFEPDDLVYLSVDVECVAATTTTGPGDTAVTTTVTTTAAGGDTPLCTPDDDHACHVVPVGDHVAHVKLPREIVEGEAQGEVCVTDTDGTLVGVMQWFFSWFPESGEPSHVEFSIDGCGFWSMSIRSGAPGSMWTSNGTEAVPFADFAG